MSRTSVRTAAAAAVTALVALAGTACSSSSSSSSKPSSSDGGGGGGTHTVKTAMGDVKVPNHPARVVVLDTNELDDALTLGVTPVGATRADVDSGFLDYLPKAKLEGIANVGTIGQPNLEAISNLHPDLILSNKTRDAKSYAALSKIAPTVLTETTGVTWKQNFQVHADALNRKAAAKTAVAAYRAHVAKVTAAVGGAAKAKARKISVVRFIEGAPTRLYGRGSSIGTILADVGLGRPKEQDTPEMMVELSPERLDEAGGTDLFYGSYGDASKSGESAAVKSALWKGLPPVRAGRAHPIDDQLWFQGIGYTAAGRILDELSADLTG